MSNEELIQQFFLEDRKLAEGTCRIFRSTLRRLSDSMGGKDFHALTLQDLDNFLNAMPTAATRAGNLQRVKRFLRWLYPDDLPRNLRHYSVRYTRKKVRPEDLLTPEEIGRLVDGCGLLRDKAFVMLLWGTGCRVSEIRTARVKDIKRGGEELPYILVDGKTGEHKTRIRPEAIPLVTQWITYLKPASGDQPLFPPQHDYKKPMNYPTVRLLLAKAAKRAGITKRVHAHLFRHIMATDLIRKLGEDKAKRVMGYSDNFTTIRLYSHLTDTDTENAFREFLGKPPSTLQGPQPLPVSSYTHPLARDREAEIDKLKKEVDMMTDVAYRLYKKLEELEAATRNPSES